MSGIRIGVDLGGTKIEAVAMSGEGEEIARERIDAPQGDYRDSIEAVVEVAGLVERAAGAARGPLGIGIPGSTSPSTGLVRNANSTWLNGRPFETDLQEAWGAPVRLANDANCFALSEATDGAAAGAASVFGVIVGTGVGGGLVVDGRLIGGANGIGGEWGHTPLPAPTAQESESAAYCWCGRRSCMEVWGSGPALAADYGRATGETVTGREVSVRAEAGDEAARAAIERHGDRLGRGLAMVMNIFDPEVIVLGGGLSNLPGLVERAHRAMLPHVFSDVCVTRITVNRHGDSSGVRGAARLWPLKGA